MIKTDPKTYVLGFLLESFFVLELESLELDSLRVISNE